jgi:cell division initiation protein
MHLTPLEISQKLFTKRMMGYDLQEVTDFLYMISSQLEELMQERNKLREALKEKEYQLFEFKEREKLLKDTISTAAQMAEKIRVDSEREAKMIITEAKTKAEFITRDARDSIGRTYEEMTNIKKVKVQFEAQVRAVIQSHLELLQQSSKLVQNPPMQQHQTVDFDDNDL